MMFKRTLRRLSVRISVVFLLIFIIFGTVIYGYVSYRFFDKVDDSMRLKANNLGIANGRIVFQSRNRWLFDPRILIFLRDTDGRVFNMFPREEIDVERLAELIAHTPPTGRIYTKEIEDHAYRILNIPYLYEDNILQTDRGPIVVDSIIAVSIVDSEVAALGDLLIIIASGLVTGMIIIIIAGYYLARRSMVPIQASWEKQQQFVADASHELRTPLAVVKSNAELILRHPGHTVEEESIRVTNIIREVRRMTKLVSELLTLARSDANQLELMISAVSLNQVTETIAEQFVPLAEMEGLTLTIKIADQLELMADKERLHQLLVILLDNAIKYTPPPGEILVTADKHGNNIIIAVEDSGQGIPAQDLPRVFDRFYRGDKARSRESGGTGLGLSIAKWIVEQHGGKISVENKAAGGAKFSVVLPIKKSS
ncbi:sensor histidine kinase [Sporomusa acidovorans]|uniref:histidine kinase n=1 Tax=Sporomusa acidovorans (strain ATCC 49682 / DSM 3132 / Mol) TaxID=1123286 RepID=A0ABZ3IXP0_SPOA4|nr:ATP-binding protein [Sporomusa acidovorans]OZC22379.1 signal transduction histidine-protein kinase ArlS [Sporomusa acidovorans DSM 3132]SDE47441.1 His Kinase A (phospho-acceptor) domain-containing protein [Sporomusa acidovorans]